jgi:hypothetical protein
VFGLRSSRVKSVSLSPFSLTNTGPPIPVETNLTQLVAEKHDSSGT